jgi:uracil-DNA glycosylase
MLKLNVIEKVIDESWTVEDIAKNAPPPSWKAVFEDAMPELMDITEVLAEQEAKFGSYYPLKKDIFKAFHLTPLKQVKVVIVGQDPYPQTISLNGKATPRAVGLSFSVRQEDIVPSSLSNIYKELSDSIPGFQIPDHGDLREWALQGVLLLNMCLTLQPGKPASHGDIWLGFIYKVLKAIASVNAHCIFLLWGKHAQDLKVMLGERSVVLEAAHPSGYSARTGFFGCGHFKTVNEILIKQGKIGINWQITPIVPFYQPVVCNNYILPASKFMPALCLTPINPISNIFDQQSKVPVKNVSVTTNNQKQLPIIPHTKTVKEQAPVKQQPFYISKEKPASVTIPQVLHNSSSESNILNSGLDHPVQLPIIKPLVS